MGVGYLPEPLPDELLHSRLARLARHRGVASAGLHMEELFGRRHAIASVDLPGGLGELSSRLGAGPRWDVDAIIDEATLHPFYAATASPAVVASTRMAMAGSVAGVHTRFGIAAFRIPAPRRPRYCPDCCREMDRSFGERYWRRSHQLPGIPVCPEHGTPLRELPQDLRAGSRHRFPHADGATRSGAADVRPPDDPDVALRLHQLAAAAAALLDRRPAGIEALSLAAGYRDRLAAVGLASSTGRTDQRGLAEAVERYWGGALPRVLGARAPGLERTSWLAPMVHPRPRAAHPVLHLLLDLFLGSRDLVEPPFGTGPWICRNPVADHAGLLIVTRVRIRRDGAVLYGDHECGCGYVYTVRRDPGGTTGPPRFRRFGPTLAPALASSLACGDGLRATARRLGLEPRTLVREAALAGVAVPWAARPSGTPAARAEAPGVPAPAARRTRSRHGGRPRDWSLIDRRTAREVEVQARAIMAEEPPMRATLSEIERRATGPGWIQKRRAKLPATVSRLHGLVETTHEFRLRRLRRVLSGMLPDGACATPSDFLRAAGLPTSWLPLVRAELARLSSEAYARSAA